MLKAQLSLLCFLFISLNNLYGGNFCFLKVTKSGAEKESIEIKYLDNFFKNEFASFEKEVTNETTEFHFYLTSSNGVTLRSGDRKFWLFFNPGDSVSIDLTGDNISFLGKNKDNGEFANKYMNIIQSWEARSKNLTVLSPEAYLKEIGERDSSLSQLLLSYKNLITAPCYDFYFYDNYYRTAYEKLFYRRYKRLSEFNNDYFDFLNEIKFDYEYFPSTSHYYFAYLYEYLWYKQERSDKPLKVIDVILKRHRIKQYKYAPNLYTGRALEFVRADIILRAIDDKVRFRSIAKHFLKTYPGSEFSGILENLLNKSKELKEGKPAPLFVLENSEGEDVYLNQYKGKVVYLIFWSSGCIPCIENIPKIKEIESRFKENPNVAFLHISLDENPNMWKKSISKYSLDGVNLIANWQEIGNLYNFQAIPFYVLIDKRGNISGYYSPKSNQIEKKIEELL